jgi:hypothetical protein
VPESAGTVCSVIIEPKPSKYWIFVEPALSTSVKTEPKAFTVAGVVVPGIKNSTSVMLLPSAVKSRCGEKVWNVAG